MVAPTYQPRDSSGTIHLVEQVIPWVPIRQWVVSVPIPLRYWMAASTHLMAQVQTIIRRTIHQYHVNQAVKQGHPREQVQAGSVTFVQRFGSSLNLNLHDHFICLEGGTWIVPIKGSSRSLSSSRPPAMPTLPLW